MPFKKVGGKVVYIDPRNVRQPPPTSKKSKAANNGDAAALADEYKTATSARKAQITKVFKARGLGHPKDYPTTKDDDPKDLMETFVASPHKYFILAHGNLSRETFTVPPRTAIVFMTYAGSVTTNPVVSQVLRTEQQARDLIRHQHKTLYSVTYFPGDTVQEHDLDFPLYEEGRGIWKVPMKLTFRCVQTDNPTPNDLKYTQGLRQKSSIRVDRTVLSYVVEYIRSRVDSSEPLVIFCGSCRFTKHDYLYQLCKQKNDAVCRRLGIPTMDMTRSDAYRRGREEYRRVF